MATLEEIHNTEIEMLQYLDEVCEKLGIHYSLMSGTLLGAVRHEGFIPWDDDIDVCMKLDDFSKLEKAFHSTKYFLQTPHTDREAMFAMYKLRKNGTLMVEPIVESLNIHHGLWIDIFVYVDSAKGRIGQKIQYTLFNILRSYRCRFLHAKRDQQRKLFIILSKLPTKVGLKIDDYIMRLIKMLGTKESNYYFMLDVGKQYLYKKEFFDHLKKYKFEDFYFWGVENFDAYLSQIYGKDYMIPKQWGHIPDYSSVIV